uniref:Uncharacterized protein n=1 Tax=Crocodylus porosus TaxID=8502 RepID=A0A7M4ESR0_CROPO
YFVHLNYEMVWNFPNFLIKTKNTQAVPKHLNAESSFLYNGLICHTKWRASSFWVWIHCGSPKMYLSNTSIMFYNLCHAVHMNCPKCFHMTMLACASAILRPPLLLAGKTARAK